MRLLREAWRFLADAGRCLRYVLIDTGSSKHDSGTWTAVAAREAEVEHWEWCWSVVVGDLGWSRVKSLACGGSDSCFCSWAHHSEAVIRARQAWEALEAWLERLALLVKRGPGGIDPAAVSALLARASHSYSGTF